MGKISVESRLAGEALAMPKVVLSLEATSLSVRDLISHAVSAQINALVAIEKQQSDHKPDRGQSVSSHGDGDPDALSAKAMLDRHYLNDSEVRQQADQGKVAVNQRPLTKGVDRGPVRIPAIQQAGQRQMPAISSADQIDPAAEIDKAIYAFEKGVFVTFVNGHQCTSLDEQIPLASAMKAQFLRLVPLAGG